MTYGRGVIMRRLVIIPTEKRLCCRLSTPNIIIMPRPLFDFPGFLIGYVWKVDWKKDARSSFTDIASPGR